MNRSKSRLFLLEMIIIILFFAIAAAVCMNLFVQAKQTSTQSTELTMAVSKAQYAAEEFKAEAFSGAMQEDVAAYYDADWNETGSGEGAAYQVRTAAHAEGGLVSADIIVSRDGQEIYRIRAAVYGEGT